MEMELYKARFGALQFNIEVNFLELKCVLAQITWAQLRFGVNLLLELLLDLNFLTKNCSKAQGRSGPPFGLQGQKTQQG